MIFKLLAGCDILYDMPVAQLVLRLKILNHKKYIYIYYAPCSIISSASERASQGFTQLQREQYASGDQLKFRSSDI